MIITRYLFNFIDKSIDFFLVDKVVKVAFIYLFEDAKFYTLYKFMLILPLLNCC